MISRYVSYTLHFTTHRNRSRIYENLVGTLFYVCANIIALNIELKSLILFFRTDLLLRSSRCTKATKQVFREMQQLNSEGASIPYLRS